MSVHNYTPDQHSLDVLKALLQQNNAADPGAIIAWIIDYDHQRELPFCVIILPECPDIDEFRHVTRQQFGSGIIFVHDNGDLWYFTKVPDYSPNRAT